MAQPWGGASARDNIRSLFEQLDRRTVGQRTLEPVWPVAAGLLFLAALAIVPFVWRADSLAVWMLFFVPVLAGASGAIIRAMVDVVRRDLTGAGANLTTVVLGLVAGGVSGVLFVTAQLTSAPDVVNESAAYAQRSIPFAFGVGFIAGLTSLRVLRGLLGLDVAHTTGVVAGGPKASDRPVRLAMRRRAPVAPVIGSNSRAALGPHPFARSTPEPPA